MTGKQAIAVNNNITTNQLMLCSDFQFVKSLHLNESAFTKHHSSDYYRPFPRLNSSKLVDNKPND